MTQLPRFRGFPDWAEFATGNSQPTADEMLRRVRSNEKGIWRSAIGTPAGSAKMAYFEKFHYQVGAIDSAEWKAALWEAVNS